MAVVIPFSPASDASIDRLVELTRDYGTLQAAYTSLLTKREDSVLAANLERRQIGEQFRVVDPASLPERPYNETQRLAITFSGAGLGLLLGVLFVGVKEFMDSSFRSEDEVMATLSLPVLGSTWNADLDCSALGNGLATLDVRRLPLSGRPTLYGELLIGGALAHRSSGPFAGSARTLGWSIPNDMALCGLDFHAQGLCTSTSFGRGKTLRMRAGLSNAIDLVLGF